VIQRRHCNAAKQGRSGDSDGRQRQRSIEGEFPSEARGRVVVRGVLAFASQQSLFWHLIVHYYNITGKK
jgi:hypothetical protein